MGIGAAVFVGSVNKQMKHVIRSNMAKNYRHTWPVELKPVKRRIQFQRAIVLCWKRFEKTFPDKYEMQLYFSLRTCRNSRDSVVDAMKSRFVNRMIKKFNLNGVVN